MPSRLLLLRFVVFTLASMSFACLLGEFYSLWSMRAFACVILLPATLVLVALAIAGSRLGSEAIDRAQSTSARQELAQAATWIREGALGGIMAAIAYDLFRVPFVLSGYPLFKVFPEFGRMLLESSEPQWLVHVVGWAYHFSNGAALGIMFLCLVPHARPRTWVVAGVAWALLVETILLLTPYRDFFKIHMPFTTFLILTASAHAIFGVALGSWCAKRIVHHTSQA
ncbi:MAG: hypothetical protein JWN98_2477 [Abditibacteriota bacterium]|nr:hypothetical protein [Abditibacteriota bacterium]